MDDAHEKKLQAKYVKEWLGLKHLLIAKHFSGQRVYVLQSLLWDAI